MGRLKKKAFLLTKDRVANRLNGWLGKQLSWAGREVLVKAVAQAIPTYTMSLFKFPKELCDDIQAIINKFW